MSVERLADILEDYDGKCSLYESFTEKMHDLIEELLEENSVPVHSVTCRIKDRDRLEEKVRTSDGKYEKLEDVTDISGIRVITYFANDVDVVAEIIKQEFVIDQDNSVDKREIMHSNTFGYLSLHYVVSLNEDREILTEYRRFQGCKCEIQIRSILQHAWAEIEHDLGYKTALDLPWQDRRRFTRIAGLLEVADSEFISIKHSIREYGEKISKQFRDQPEEVYIDKPSLTLFLTENETYREISKDISTQSGVNIMESVAGDDNFLWPLSNLISEYDYLKINTLSQLEVKLIEKRDIVIKFAVDWLKPSSDEPSSDDKSFLSPAISLLYLNYCLAGETGSLDYAMNFVKITRKVRSRELLETLAKRIIETYEKYRIN